MTDTLSLERGTTPLLISVPHAGPHLPDGMAERLTEGARGVPDTDWHVDRLYGFARALGATVLTAHYSRYVVDLNRPPDDQSLYPGQATTGLCPTESFDGDPIYRRGQEPSAAERAERLETYWRPYHDRLAAELADLRQRHGVAMLFDAHSIRSVVPRLFEGRLPDLNLGTARGSSCAPDLRHRLTADLDRQQRYSTAVDGRFVGGYITRAYGRPDAGIHAVQMEIAQDTYMLESPPWTYHPEKAATLQEVLRGLQQSMLDWCRRA